MHKQKQACHCKKHHGHCCNENHEKNCKPICCKRKPNCDCEPKCSRNCEHHCVDMTESVAEMEKALAKVLETEAKVLKDHGGQWSEKQRSEYMAHMENTLKKVILKEIVLLFMLEEKCPPDCTPHKPDCYCKDCVT